MPDLFAALKSPGLWMALAAVVLNMAARPIAGAVKPDDEEGQSKVTLWIKTVSLALAVCGFILVAKAFLF